MGTGPHARKGVSRSCSLVAARWALVLLDVLGPGWSDLHTLAVEPPLTHITADPELVGSIVLSARTTQGIPVFVLIFLI